MNGNSIGIVTMPISSSGIPAVRKLIDLISPLSKDIYLVTGDEGARSFSSYGKVKLVEIKHRAGESSFSRALQFALTQVRISISMLCLNRKVGMWILFIGGDVLILPMFSTRLVRKPTAILFSGSSNQLLMYNEDGLHPMASILAQLNSSMADKLVLYSPCLVEKYDLDRYSSKVLIADHHFQDFASFKRTKEVSERENVIAYFGRFSEEKGVLDLLRAIPLVLDKEVKFQLFGNGALKQRMLDLIDKLSISDKVEIKEWVKYNELPDQLNRIKALILPSYTEGMPNILLEAMSCGTPAIATSAGAIPDVIKDEETGFLIKENTPEAIANAIDRMISSPNLKEIAKRGEDLIHREFTFENRSVQWKDVISALGQEKGIIKKARTVKRQDLHKVQ